MKVTCVKDIGLCCGVKNALSTIERAIKENPKSKIICLGMIAHNQVIIDELKAKDVTFIMDNFESALESFNKDTVIVFAAHGHDKNLDKICEQKGIRTYDTCCSFLKKNLTYNSNKILYIGDKNHTETKTYLDNKNNAILYTDELSLSQFKNTDVLVLNQTTFNEEKLLKIHSKIAKEMPNAVIKNTLCPFMLNRFKEIESLSDDVDLIIVCGDSCSSNANRILEKAKLIHPNIECIMANSIKDIENIKNKNHIILTSATSCPNNVVTNILNFLKTK